MVPKRKPQKQSGRFLSHSLLSVLWPTCSTACDGPSPHGLTSDSWSNSCLWGPCLQIQFLASQCPDCMICFHPSCKTLRLSLVNFMRFLLMRISPAYPSCLKDNFMSSNTLSLPPALLLSANSPRMCSSLSPTPSINMLNSFDLSISLWETSFVTNISCTMNPMSPVFHPVSLQEQTLSIWLLRCYRRMYQKPC